MLTNININSLKKYSTFLRGYHQNYKTIYHHLNETASSSHGIRPAINTNRQKFPRDWTKSGWNTGPADFTQFFCNDKADRTDLRTV